jgi:hypothetical protein
MQPYKSLFINTLVDLEHVQRNKKKEKGEFRGCQVSQTKCQNLSISKIDHM